MKTKCFDNIDLSSSTLFGFEFTSDNIGLLVQKSSGEFICVEMAGVTEFNLTTGSSGVNVFVEEATEVNKYLVEDDSGHPFLTATAKTIELNGQL